MERKEDREKKRQVRNDRWLPRHGFEKRITQNKGPWKKGVCGDIGKRHRARTIERSRVHVGKTLYK